MDSTRDGLLAGARAALARGRETQNLEAITFLEEARDAFIALGHNRDPHEWLECQGRLGYLYVETERFDDAVEPLLSALETSDALGMTSEHYFCARWLGRAYAGAGRYRDAEHVLREAHQRAADARADEELARCAETYAEVLTAAGHLDRSGPMWLQAADIHLRLGDDIGAARCAESLCLTGAIGNDYADAIGLLRALKHRFAAAGLRENVAECDLWIGMTYSAYGRPPLAETALTAAADECQRLLEAPTGPSAVHANELLRAARIALADLHMRRGDFPAATTVLRAVTAADAGLHVLEISRVRIMQAQCARALGDTSAAHGLLTSTRTLLADRTDMPARILNANCLEHLGLVALSRGHRAQALSTLADARACYDALGATARMANADALIGAAVLHSAPGRPADGDAAHALDLLVPAFLYLDGLRFQFPGTADRVAWKAQSAWVLRESLEAATALTASPDDDAVKSGTRLIAELVETIINSGVHSSATGGAQTMTATARLLGSLGGSADPVRAPGAPAAWAEGPAGAGLLLSDLPMRPPPRLLMPDKTIALQQYHQLRAANYPDTMHQSAEGCPTV